MNWTAADVALILTAGGTTIATLWGVVFPSFNARSERRRARVQAVANDFHEVLAGCINTCERASRAASNRALNVAALNAGMPLTEKQLLENRDGDEFTVFLQRLEVLSARFGLDTKKAIFSGRCLNICGDDYEFRDGKLISTPVDGREEPEWSIKNRTIFLQEISKIYLLVDGWVEKGAFGK